ncbi:MAG: HepT-like ribonuclease domain-containing protein [Acidobacteriota bacterium]
MYDECRLPDLSVRVLDPDQLLSTGAIAGMRDKLIHDYFGVDYEIVWDAVIVKIPGLKTAVTVMLQE